jgi:hypothetical protein
MFSEHSTFGKSLIVICYLTGVLLFFTAIIATLFTLGELSSGYSMGGQKLDTGDSILRVLGIPLIWFLCGMTFRLAHLLRTFGNVKLCRVFSFILCLLFPWGTALGAFVLIYIRNENRSDTGW